LQTLSFIAPTSAIRTGASHGPAFVSSLGLSEWATLLRLERATAMAESTGSAAADSAVLEERWTKVTGDSLPEATPGRRTSGK